jgi:hypothetical protein
MPNAQMAGWDRSQTPPINNIPDSEYNSYLTVLQAEIERSERINASLGRMQDALTEMHECSLRTSEMYDRFQAEVTL